MDLKEKQLTIIKHYGLDRQLDMLIEECAELIQAICKLQRTKQSPELFNYNLVEEMADVENVIEQFKLDQPKLADLIDSIKDNKTSRQMHRIQKETRTSKDPILINVVEDLERNTDYLNCPDCGVDTERVYSWGKDRASIFVRCERCGTVFETARIKEVHP